MKKKLLYLAPSAEVYHLSLDKSLLTTSDTDLSGGIDDAIEDVWGDVFAAPGLIFLMR